MWNGTPTVDIAWTPLSVSSYNTVVPVQNYEDERFKWRGKPEETFSDWTIEIITTNQSGQNGGSKGATTQVDGEIVTSYHVHRGTLAYGARKSEYFARLFRSASAGRFREAHSRKSRINLEPLAASAFPALLDYVYAPDDDLRINTDTATASQYLGDYFEMQRLKCDATQFCSQDISLENLGLYYDHAMIFKNQTIRNVVTRFTGENLTSVEFSSTIIQKAEPKFWMEVIQGPFCLPSDSNVSTHWSKLVAEIGTLHAKNMDSTAFQQLTAASKMPEVDQGVALVLCELDDSLRSGCDNEATDNVKPDSSSLQHRCASVVAENWEILTPSYETIRMLERRTPSFLTKVFVQSMESARSELQKCRNNLDAQKEETQKNAKLLKAANDKLARFRPCQYGRSVPGSFTAVPHELCAPSIY